MPITLTGTAIGRDERRAQAAEKHEDDDDDQHEGIAERDQHVVDRGADEGGRVVIDQIFEARREALAQAVQRGNRPPKRCVTALAPGDR